MKFSNRFKILLKLSPYIWPKDSGIRLRFLAAIFLLIATIALNVGVPLILKQVIDLISSPSSTLIMTEILLISYGVVWTFSKLTDKLRFVVFIRVVERGMRLLCLNIFNHLISLSFRFHTSRKTGALLSTIERAQFAFWPFFCGLFFLIVPTIIEIVIAAGILIYLYGCVYGIILTTTLIAYMIISIYGSQWTTVAQSFANEKTSQVTATIVDSLLNYETIHHFVSQKYEAEKCDHLLLEREIASTKHHTRGELVTLGQGIIMGIGLIALTWLSGTQVMSGVLKVSDFILINVYLLQFMAPLGNFGYVLRDMNEGITNLEEATNILEEKPDIQDKPNAPALTLTSGVVTFDKVNFGYDSQRIILKEISFKIPAKKTIAIVGATGSGKSTLSKLLFRSYDVDAGRILIDEQDIRDVAQQSLHTLIGIVPQHAALFNDTLHYNIAYGRPDAAEAEIQQAIKHAHIDTFIAKLPDGLNTLVGEQGLKLSGGERQRVAIARMLLKKPSIFIFDEATSSLDTKTEQLIQKNIEEISRNTTTLIIAHRLSTVVHADEIIVLDHGQIVERGSHEALLDHNGLYAQLWAKQTGGVS
ncbi:MAG: ABC transporter ATP-binding protein/permease [Gammaproteobacteria bacterium]|nr:ABC transporter ATP-binding protein/permease [Gammaproteobacteria bacterium]